MERIANLGYLGLKKQVDSTTAITPDDYVPLYEEDILTDVALSEADPVAGNVIKVWQFIKGQRSHKGNFTIMAEPNTSARIVDAFMTQGAVSGAGPYTHPFTVNGVTGAHNYTFDISTGNVVFRYIGAQVSELKPIFNENEMRLQLKLSALKSFSVRQLVSMTPGTPNTIVLNTEYDPSPTDGLVAGDLIRFTKADGTTIDTTVTAITDGVTLTCGGTLTGVTLDDFVSLRPATPSYTLKSPFLFARTEFRFADTAANALTATQVRCEKGSEYTLMYPFESDNGSQRSGAFDPASLVRTRADASIMVKRFMDGADQVNKFLTQEGQALVVRHFSETGYEFRVTFNALTYKTGGKPKVKSGEILYHEFEAGIAYKPADSQGFDVKVINGISGTI